MHIKFITHIFFASDCGTCRKHMHMPQTMQIKFIKHIFLLPTVAHASDIYFQKSPPGAILFPYKSLDPNYLDRWDGQSTVFFTCFETFHFRPVRDGRVCPFWILQLHAPQAHLARAPARSLRSTRWARRRRRRWWRRRRGWRWPTKEPVQIQGTGQVKRFVFLTNISIALVIM
jgi:hypothetical protein